MFHNLYDIKDNIMITVIWHRKLSFDISTIIGIGTRGQEGHGLHRVLEVCYGLHTISVYWLLNKLASYTSYLIQLLATSVTASYNELSMNSTAV